MQDFFIWGCNPFAETLFRMVQPTKTVNIIGFVEQSNQIKAFCDKPVYSPEELKAQINYAHVPIVIASNHPMLNDVPAINFESIRLFKERFAEALSENMSNHLLHPAALVDFLCIDFSDKIVTFGSPGAGNVLFNQILQKISEKCQYPEKTKSALFFEQLCYEYSAIMFQVFTDIFYKNGGYNIHSIPWKVGTTSYHCSLDEKNVLDIFAFPTRDHIFTPTYGYHLMPSENYLANLHANKCKAFYVIRNPLDMILSIINKDARVNRDDKTIQMEPFCRRSRWLITQLNTWLPIISKMKVLNYDELINQPVPKIQKMMEYFADDLVLKKSYFRPQKVLVDTAQSIWDQFSFKQLDIAPQKHFWKGGCGKWETFFQAEHLSFLKAFGIESLLERLGFYAVLDKFKQLSVSISKDSWKEACSTEFVDTMLDKNIFAYVDEHDDSTVSIKQYGRTHHVKVGNFFIACNELGYIDRIKQDLTNPFINQLFLSGAHANFQYFLN